MNKIKKLAIALASVDDATLDKIDILEKEGRYNEHTDVASAPYREVGGDYDYFPKTTPKTAFQKRFIISPFRKFTNKLFGTEVTGREKLDSVHGAILCCNHVNKLDCMAIQFACRPRRTFFTAAQFNNMTGFLGDMMRLGGMLPMGESYSALKNLDMAIEKIVGRGDFVTFFPERAEWWGYEKPRPLSAGAFRFAVKNNVPVIPLFITFRQTAASKADRKGLKQFVVNISDPIYPPENICPEAAKTYLMSHTAEAWEKIYDEFYVRSKDE